MRPRLRRAKRPCINRSGQAILELAIFGSLLLFVLALLVQYGLSLNYDQNLQMQTFRKALALAKERAGTSQQVDITVVKDQAIPNPADQFGASETSPYIAQASAVWTNRLGDEIENWLPKADLPHIDYIINGQQKSYTTANYGYKYCSGSEIPPGDSACDFPTTSLCFYKKENDVKDEYILTTPLFHETWENYYKPVKGSDGIYWYWKKAPCEETEAGDSVDIDNDGKEEMIYKVSKVKNSQNTSSIYYFKLQDGEIDTTKNKDLDEEPQGLQPGFTKTITKDNTSLEKWEDKSQIKTTTKSNIKEVIKRTIKTNQGDEDVQSTIEKENESTWTTPWQTGKEPPP